MEIEHFVIIGLTKEGTGTTIDHPYDKATCEFIVTALIIIK